MTINGKILELVQALNGYGIILYVLITSCIAVLLSLALCLERELRGKSFSIKTHTLLSLGSCFLMSVSIWAIRIADGSIDGVVAGLSYDTSRVAAAVVTGMGFLGAGVILKDRQSVKGLSTAASLWISAAIGLACGTGFILEAIVFTVLILVVLFIINGINVEIGSHAPSILITSDNEFPVFKIVSDLADDNKTTIKDFDVVKVGEEVTEVRIRFLLKTNEEGVKYFINQLHQYPEIKKIEIEKRK